MYVDLEWAWETCQHDPKAMSYLDQINEAQLDGNYSKLERILDDAIWDRSIDQQLTWVFERLWDEFEI